MKIQKLKDLENYFQQQLRMIKAGTTKYSGVEAYEDAAEVVANLISSSHPLQQRGKEVWEWVKASEFAPPEELGIDIIGKSKQGRIDIYSWDNMTKFHRPYIHEADELFEWLRRSTAPVGYSEAQLRAGISAGLSIGYSPNYNIDNREKEIDNIISTLQPNDNNLKG